MAKLRFVVERGRGTSTSMSSEWCGGARRPAWHLERGCPSTPWRIFGNISIRRKPAVTSVPLVASGRRLRSTSGVPNTHPKGSALSPSHEDLLAHTYAGPSGAVRHAEELQRALYHRLRP